MKPRYISVIGGGECGPAERKLAEEVGALVAQRGATLICGGLGGVMEAVCKGAKSEQGLTIGVLPGDDKSEANPYVDVAIATGMGIGRNLIIIRSADAVISISGGFGTLSEIAFALQLQKPVVGINTWDISDRILTVQTAKEAINKIDSLFSQL